MSKTPVIIDCDPGHDDAIALMLAAMHGSLNILGITAVGGNNTVENSVRNALAVLDHLGLSIPVYQGAAKPLVQKLKPALDIHGVSGLDGTSMKPPHSRVQSMNAITFLEQTLRDAPAPITVIALGPLTNIALLIRTAPEVVPKIKRLCIMGGAATGGNCIPTAEFNIWQDPEAADIVFNAGLDLTMTGLDVTYKSWFDWDDIKAIGSLGTPVGKLAEEILTYFGRVCEDRHNMGIPVHDAVAVAYVLKPELFKSQHLNVVIDLDGHFTRGCTVTDLIKVTGRPRNCRVLLDVDRKGFINFVTGVFAQSKREAV